MEIKDKIKEIINKDLREKILNLKAYSSSKSWLSLANISEFLGKEFKKDHKDEFTTLFESAEWKNYIENNDACACCDESVEECLKCGVDFNFFYDIINDYLNSHNEESNIINNILVENNKEDNLSSYYWKLQETYPNLSHSSQDKTFIYTFKGANKAIITIDDNLIPSNKQFGFHPTVGKLIKNLLEALDKEGYKIDGNVYYRIYYNERLNWVDWEAKGLETIPAHLLMA